MDLTSTNFDSILQKKLNEINKWYDQVDNAGLARLSADETCVKCIKNKGYAFIILNKDEKNDCKSNYLDYNNLSWKELINKVFQKEVKIGGRKKKIRKTNKNKKISKNRKKIRKTNKNKHK
jgi:hypothetical protein